MGMAPASEVHHRPSAYQSSRAASRPPPTNISQQIFSSEDCLLPSRHLSIWRSRDVLIAEQCPAASIRHHDVVHIKRAAHRLIEVYHSFFQVRLGPQFRALRRREVTGAKNHVVAC